jgi:hypothetical protein
MPLRDYFEASFWIGHAVTGRTACRVYVTMVLLFLVATTVARAYSFVLPRRIQAVIYGLSKQSTKQPTGKWYEQFPISFEAIRTGA